MVKFTRYKFETALNCLMNSPESQPEFDAFQRLPWWHGDNSWWERVGWDVRGRRRFAGVETASGEYVPPFAMQHPKMPFQLLQVPFWACLLLSASPAIYLVIRWRKVIWDAFAPAGHAED